MNAQALIKLDGKGWDISATSEAQKIKAGLVKLAGGVKVVKDKATEASAKKVLTELASFRKQLESTRKQIKEPILALGKQVDAIAGEFGQEVLDEETRIKGILGNYAEQVFREQEKLRLEAEAARLKAEEEAAKAEAARLKAERTERAMDEAQAARAEDKAIVATQQAVAMEVQAETHKVKGVSMVFDFEVTDIRELDEYDESLVSMEPKRAAILDELKRLERMGKDPVIPGLRVFKRPSVRA